MRVAVVGHEIVDDALAGHALNHGDIEQPGWSPPTATDTADRFHGEA
jgi:hypothetical protein